PMLGLAAPAFDVAVGDDGTVVTSGRLQGVDDARIQVGVVQKSLSGLPFNASVSGLQVQAMAFGGAGADGRPLLFVQTRATAAKSRPHNRRSSRAGSTPSLASPRARISMPRAWRVDAPSSKAKAHARAATPARCSATTPP